ncbi:piggyBac transposable element-derived protein 3-like [Hydra vulgaris]|uniref:PiggyBac transposable element-derived protein 3-like n=1 Tax=Hydra vulgaris TaxID=6087 RepID=A0ABM4CTW3_HYDVU
MALQGKKLLCDKRFTVEGVLQHLDDSELKLSDSDDSGDETFNPSAAADMLTDENEDEIERPDEDEPSTSVNSGNKRQKKTQIKWRSLRGAFESSSELQDNLNLGDSLLSPSLYIFNYFNPEIFETFAEQTNIYHLRKTGKTLNTTTAEIQKFFGITIVTANLGFPRIRMYWQRATRVNAVADVMPVNRYFQLRNSIRINADPNPEQGTNKFWKVQPLINTVRSRCLKLPREEYNSVDKQMIPFTGRVPAKQYIRGKPNPVGVKNFVVCYTSGRADDFELYQGAGTGISEEHKHLGLGASIVLRLSETTPQHKTTSSVLIITLLA